ncbi:PhzF family phenazine biosynthesis protein [Ohtaekwangia sp.]|uniref:PhzF family phenazine biosynthesis protein n=1 Tax=Ohtaekwangia sp. TaxID=2066019 RepID=UPI002F95D5EA
MKELDYYVLDVFTDQRYKGNQLAVVHCTEELTSKQYHAIAREFGFSETSFIHYSEKDHALAVRSFTPGEFEVVGAGHNLLGAVCLALIKRWDIFKDQQGDSWVIIKDTKIPLAITGKNSLPYVAMKQKKAEVIAHIPFDTITKAVGLSVSDLNLNHWDISVVQTEVAHLMVPVKNSEALQRAVPDKIRLKEASEKYGFEGCYLFTTDHPHTSILAETRFFNPGIGIDEDPATGTAAGPLAGYLEQQGYIKQDTDYTILQGVAVKHPSYIHVKVSGDGIWISGSSVIVMEGTLYL